MSTIVTDYFFEKLIFWPDSPIFGQKLGEIPFFWPKIGNKYNYGGGVKPVMLAVKTSQVGGFQTSLQIKIQASLSLVSNFRPKRSSGVAVSEYPKFRPKRTRRRKNGPNQPSLRYLRARKIISDRLVSLAEVSSKTEVGSPTFGRVTNRRHFPFFHKL